LHRKVFTYSGKIDDDSLTLAFGKELAKKGKGEVAAIARYIHFVNKYLFLLLSIEII
jgi:hypothetical protein